jgi:hypothetical protein
MIDRIAPKSFKQERGDKISELSTIKPDGNAREKSVSQDY